MTGTSAHQIAAALGGRRSGSRNAFLCRCPAHADRTPSLSVCDASDRVLFRCHAGCSQDAVLDALRARGLFSRDRAVTRNVTLHRSSQDEDARRADYVGGIWSESIDPRGTLGERNLNRRKLTLDDGLCGRVLRFHNRCPFGKDEAGKTIYVPALIIAFRPVRDDDESTPPRAIHRIGLKPDATRIGKMMLGPVGGCAVKLDPDDMVEEGLGICEGVETGLAVRATGWRPIWALGSAGAIARFAPIAGIEALTIFADHDANGIGIKAARECAQRWADAGLEAVIRTPLTAGEDWADA